MSHKKKYRIGICGFFDSSVVGENGQTVRTKNITNELIKHYGDDKVKCISTHNWRTRPVALFFDLIRLCKNSDRVLLFPDTRAVKVIVPLCVMLKKVCKVKVYYNVVGGWLASRLENQPILCKYIKLTDMLFIQTATMKQELAAIGVMNTTIFPNFKLSRTTDTQHCNMTFNTPYPCCFYSRVTAKKGVDKMVSAVEKVNRYGNLLKLDIYGHVDEQYKAHFTELMESSSEMIKYCGEIPNSRTVDVLEDYFLQIFPTEYSTEGHPGSLIDSIYAGLPVIASRWNSCGNIVVENVTGITYDFASEEALIEKLVYCVKNQDKVNAMRGECVKYAVRYSPEGVMKIMYRVFDDDLK